ncbi:hypothetical protein EB235_19045 [Mesorhizobium loti R88b]|uniref:Uncharacterized protein n=1 Tax=Mesorhizobium loti R88b TaxID=935548 RepID=A0A6M7WN07_RHILI|nr:hypothetical protein EB235_19045 [Mesorhizobium loti R88b]
MSSGSGDAAWYRAGRIRKANIAPWPFDWPTPTIAWASDHLPHDMAVFIKDRLFECLCRS